VLFRTFGFASAFFSRGGLCTCSFSWVFWAKLAVGRVILARKPSAGALCTLLVRGLWASGPPCCDANDALELFFASDEAVVEVGGLAVGLWGCDVPTILALAVAVVLARLAGRLGPVLALATEAVVGAIAPAGRRAGFVGDRGWTLLLGEVGDCSFFMPLLVGCASEAFDLVDCGAFGFVGGRELRSDFGSVGDRRDVFDIDLPESSGGAELGEETFAGTFGEIGVFDGGLLGVEADLVVRGRIRPPAGKTGMAFLLAMKFPLGGGSFLASFILVANDVDCEVDFGFACVLDIEFVTVLL
jgi:hypothetical protein